MSRHSLVAATSVRTKGLTSELDAAPRAVDSVAVIGAGTMGSGIAIAALDAGLTVLLLEQDDAALARGPPAHQRPLP
jgi:NADPH-dependent 2,4-dienoyl-CoA reductase/sulfur reductase-like enzyme